MGPSNVATSSMRPAVFARGSSRPAGPSPAVADRAPPAARLASSRGAKGRGDGVRVMGVSSWGRPPGSDAHRPPRLVPLRRGGVRTLLLVRLVRPGLDVALL